MTDVNNVQVLLYLSACALHGVQPEKERLKGVDLAELYKLATFHSMTAITAMALESSGIFDGADVNIVKKWISAKNEAIRKNLLLDNERQRLFAWMEEHGCWHMPLKGSVLKDLYPKIGMRQMADNDILFDTEFEWEIEKYMVSQGYEAVSVGKGNHDVYEKQPIYNFELHTALFASPHNKEWNDYYANVKTRLINDAQGSFGRHFSDEDFYVYIMVHACKHYSGGGTGLRTLMDCYVYILRKGAALDWEYIEGEAEKLGIAQFEKLCRALSQKLFSLSEYELTDDEAELLGYFASSGTYGTVKHRVEKNLKEIQQGHDEITTLTRIKYFAQRTFPNKAWLEQNCPFCYRNPWARPFFYIYRIFRGVFKRGKNIYREIKIVIKTENTKQ